MADAEPAGRIVLAVAIGAHGTRGEIRLRSFAASLEAFADYGPLERSDGGPALTVIAVRTAKDGLIARLAGINDRNAAEKLKGVELWVPRERLPDPEAGEFYVADLVGLTAVRPDGTAVGEVVAVHDFGAGDLIELRLADSGATVLLPFNRETVPEIDTATGRLTIDPPEGLIEE